MFGRDRSRDAQFTDDCRHVLESARTEARRIGNPFVAPEHLLLALLTQTSSESSRALLAIGLKTAQVRSELEADLTQQRTGAASGTDIPYTSRAKTVLEGAMKEARSAGSSMDSSHLLLGIMVEARSFAAQLLRRLGVTADELRRIFRSGLGEKEELRIRIDDRSATVIYEQIVNQIKEAVATGGVRPGTRLPPVRQLADDLGIAPGTVARAYSELEASGVTVTDGSKGTFVAAPGRRVGAQESVSVRDLLRPAVIAAFHLGVSATAVREALEQAMTNIYRDTA